MSIHPNEVDSVDKSVCLGAIFLQNRENDKRNQFSQKSNIELTRAGKDVI